MKWTIKWDAQADSNDADYIYTHGTLGVFDDENKEQMQKLLFNMRMAEYAEREFRDGRFPSVGDREKIIDMLSDDGKIPKDVATKLVDEEIGDEDDAHFKDHLKEWLREFVPDDPEDDSHAHGLHISWTKIPGEVKESSFNTGWVEGKCNMITPEMLKPLIDKWEGILEIALDKSTESWCNVIRDTRTGTKFSMELLSRLYTPQNVLYELDKLFGSEHLFDSDWLPDAVLQDFNRMDSGIIYFSVNNWMYGRDYPPIENFRKWLGNDLDQSFRNEEWVKENKLCVRCGYIDMSQNYLVSAPREWVEKNCPELLTNFEYTYTTIINDKEVEHKDKYSKFVYSPDYGPDGDEFECEDRFGWPFLEYKEENIGVHWYEAEPEPEEDEPEEDETVSDN